MTTDSIGSMLSGSQDTEPTAIWVEIPTGYVSLPTDQIRENMAAATDVLGEQASAAQRPTVEAMIRLLTACLESLAARNGLYCGIGRHLSVVDGSAITSSLVVSLQEFPEEVNPRVLLKDLTLTKAEAGERGQVDLVDVEGRPMLFFERDRLLPAPRLPGQPEAPEGAMTKVFQLEALVPSDDGSKLVAIEFSTPFVAHGPEFRAMVVMMASSVSFDPPPAAADDAGPRAVRYSSVADALGG